jgi:suppressor of tumorigenicity protein 13
VTIKTFIAKLKATVDEKDAEILTLKGGDSHAHYHGHEKCTASHDHKHGHEESHSHGHDDDIPEWKKNAMDLDPSAAPFGGSWTNEAQVNATDDEANFPPLYESGEDFDQATEHKMKASDFKMEEKWEEALSEYTLAIQAAPPSALLYANRATVLLELQQFKAAERDCNEALKENPDSAKALRVRGLARKELGLWEQSRHDLSESQMIDFDQDTVEALKEVSHKVQEMEKEKVAQKLEKEAKLKKRADEIKKAQEEAKRESARSTSTSTGMPGGGMPGMSGMGGAGGMGGLMEVRCFFSLVCWHNWTQPRMTLSPYLRVCVCVCVCVCV